MLMCSRCHTAKDPEKFYRESRSKTGRTSHCKDCTKARQMTPRYKRINREGARRRYERQKFADLSP